MWRECVDVLFSFKTSPKEWTLVACSSSPERSVEMKKDHARSNSSGQGFSLGSKGLPVWRGVCL